MQLKTLEEVLKEDGADNTKINPFYPKDEKSGVSEFFNYALNRYKSYLETQQKCAELALEGTHGQIKSVRAEIQKVQNGLDVRGMLSTEVAGNKEMLEHLIRETGLYVKYVQKCLAEVGEDDAKTLRGQAATFVHKYFPDLFSSAKETLKIFKKQYAAMIRPEIMSAEALAAASNAKLLTLTDSLSRLEAQEAEYAAQGKEVERLMLEIQTNIGEKPN